MPRPSLLTRALFGLGVVVCCTADVWAHSDAEGASCGADLPGESAGLCTAPLVVEDVAAAGSAASFSSIDSTSSTLARVRARGRLICAHQAETLGHSRVESNTTASGMEPELCAGLAAAIGVEPSYWEMATPSERFPLLHAHQVDIAFALTSKTVSRDLFEHGAFSIPYFQDEHNLMVRSDANIGSAADLRGKTICVTSGTTNPNVFNDYLASHADEIGGADQVEVVAVPGDAQALQMLYDGKCHGFVNDHSVVAGYIHTHAPPSGIEYKLASWPGTPFARAPFSVVTLDGDAEFASIADWFVNGLFLAEMYGITSENADAKAADASLPGEAQRLLGVQLVNGQKLPFDLRAAIKRIGNYAQLYERNFGAFLERTKANQLYQNGGAVFPGGFR